MEAFFDLNIWISLLTLTVLEIVLGIDNMVFISILTARLPPEQQRVARAGKARPQGARQQLHEEPEQLRRSHAGRQRARGLNPRARQRVAVAG